MATAPTPGGMTYVDPSAPTVFADGSTLTAPLGQLLGGRVSVTGTVAGSKPGDAIAVLTLDQAGAWSNAAASTVAPDGTYTATWKPAHSGHLTIKAVLAAQATAATRVVGTSVSGTAEGRAVTLYKRARVTWYGPGFYGRKTACGKRMSKRLLGVAHKTLPCGTLVELYNNGNVVTVPVVDRGPFRKGTSYDLTSATAGALGVTATATIGAVRAVVPTAVSAAASR
ncbi:septal ring lytic transglycosylase RlpA family protein [Baekduia sp. Peel2402]|uniref:septal ring lytic transglycosylase RlpA family protein n=1 Tax=Baekduia sp. Peel2402 TaxID=3458296 RepID=UPI00403E3FD6